MKNIYTNHSWHSVCQCSVVRAGRDLISTAVELFIAQSISTSFTVSVTLKYFVVTFVTKFLLRKSLWSLILDQNTEAAEQMYASLYFHRFFSSHQIIAVD